MDRASKLGIKDKVNWISWLARDELPFVYANHHVLLFPSLHDSSGNVVLEALSQGLVVICLDIGGPAEIVDKSCSIVVKTRARKYASVVADLCTAIMQVEGDAVERNAMRRAAIDRARNMLWSKVVSSAWLIFSIDKL